MDFKNGDLIIALPEAYEAYRITNTKVGVMKVLEYDFSNKYIKIECYFNGRNEIQVIEKRHVILAEFTQTELYKALEGETHD